MKAHHRKEFRMMRAVAIWLHNSTCLNCCSITMHPEVHHRNHVNTDNELRNLMVLCPSCHKLYHRIPKQPLLSINQIVIALLRKIVYFKQLKK